MSEIFKNRFRFTDSYDIHLFREVYGQNPYEDPKKWYTIQCNMIQITGKSLAVRTLRERVQNLVKKYSLRTQENEVRSGIEIEVTELDDLLQQIAELIKECNTKKKNLIILKQEKKSPASYQKGFEARELASTCLGEIVEEVTTEDVVGNTDMAFEINMLGSNDFVGNAQETTSSSVKKKLPSNITTPKRKRTFGNIRQQTVQYLSTKAEKNHEIQCRELLGKGGKNLTKISMKWMHLKEKKD